MAMNVKFLRGTSAKFATIEKDALTFYLVDDNKLYLGENLLTNEITAEQFSALEVRVKALEDAGFQGQIDAIREELKNFGTSETITALDNRVKAIEDWKAALPTYVEDSVYQAHLTAQNEKDAAQDQAIATAEQNAKDYSDGKLNAVVEQYLTGEGAADTIDTLNEIAEWINNDTAGVSQIIKDVAANTQAIADEKGAREAADNTINGEIDAIQLQLNGIAAGDGTVKAAIDAAKEAAVTEAGSAADSKISAAIAAENLGQYAKTADIEGSLAKAESALQAADLADYAKTADVNSAIATATTDMATNAGVATALEPYAKSADVTTEIGNAVADKATKTELSEGLAGKVDNATYEAHLTAQSEKDSAQDEVIAAKLDSSVHTTYVEANDARVKAVEDKFAGTDVTMAQVVTAINQLADGTEDNSATINEITANTAANASAIAGIESQLTWGEF